MTTRFYFIGLMLGVPILVVGPLSIFCNRNRRRFLLAIPVLQSSEDIDALKRMVKIEMYGALMALPLAFTPIIAFFVGINLGILTLPDSLYAVVGVILNTLQGVLGKRSERPIYVMPTASKELADERDRIVEIWRTKPLPDW
jgi:hypothetical protein